MTKDMFLKELCFPDDNLESASPIRLTFGK